MKVKLLKYTEGADRLIAQAAKLCYSAVGVDEISEQMSDEQALAFIEKLNDLHHESPMEHASFTFAVEGISRSLSHQLVRHRIASYSQQSQRYVKFDEMKYVVPPQIAENREAEELFRQAMESAAESYRRIAELLFDANYRKNVENGMSETKARAQAEKLSIEDARYVFPNACETKVLFTMNTRSLLHFFELRCCERAQWEIRAMATEMLRQVKAVYPMLFRNAGPGCVRGACPEGKMTCGRAAEIRKFFREMESVGTGEDER